MSLPRHHPLWKTLHVVVVSLTVTFCFTVCLSLTASHFDATELQALAGGGVLTAIVTGVAQSFFRSERS